MAATRSRVSGRLLLLAAVGLALETRGVAVVAAAATGGLLGWEFVQPYRPDRTFDRLDACATLAGVLSFLAIVGTGRMVTAQDARKTESPTP